MKYYSITQDIKSSGKDGKIYARKGTTVQILNDDETVSICKDKFGECYPVPSKYLIEL